MSLKKFPAFTATAEIGINGEIHVFLHWHDGFRQLDVASQGELFLATLDALEEKGTDILTDVQAKRRQLQLEKKGIKNA